jgi:hypothetical protein
VASDELSVVVSDPTDAEIGVLARRLADAYTANVRWRMPELKESAEEAGRWVRGYDDPEERQRAMSEPADHVSWFTLSSLIEAEPEAGWAVWERIKAEASEQLESGHRAAQALDWDDSPWGRAQFLAIRQAFIDEWQPRGGIELTLIDQMAQAHSLYLWWIERAHLHASLEGKKIKRDLGETGRWHPRTLGTAEALDQSAQMAERWQKLFVRALRALRDLRRHAPRTVRQLEGRAVLGTPRAVQGRRRGGAHRPDDDRPAGQHPLLPRQPRPRSHREQGGRRQAWDALT